MFETLLSFTPFTTFAKADWLTLILSGLAQVIEIIGVFIILMGVFGSLYRFFRSSGKLCISCKGEDYRRLRKELGRSLLIGLELLVAGDIINTVAVKTTLESLLVLGFLITLRFFLSLTLELETDGRWPWQQPRFDDEPYDKSGEAAEKP